MQVTLSIITAAYNAGMVIDRAVRSLMLQLVEDVEWIIVDDGATDGSAAMLDELAAAHAQIHVIHTENRGAGAARNTGIRAAQGEWIAFLDADDYFTDTAIADIAALVGSSDAQDTDIFYLPKIVTDMEGRAPHVVQPESLIRNGLPDLEFWSSLYRNSYLRQADVRFPEHREQDVETAFRLLAFNRTTRIRTRHDPAFLVHRDNPDSNVHTWNPERLLRVKSTVYADLIGELADAPANVRKKIVSTLYTSIDQYLIAVIRRHIHPSKNQLQTVTRIGWHSLGRQCTAKTWAKKMLFMLLVVVTSFRASTAR
ncbi:glycosyltransferase family 2 protein [Bifidobacterium choerinum]|uniref:glycosyltransferase family 2 protein n=1 Tax=Bifidobacterium choerinum TaxID=35760 RepID=UPI003F90B019